MSQINWSVLVPSLVPIIPRLGLNSSNKASMSPHGQPCTDDKLWDALKKEITSQPDLMIQHARDIGSIEADQALKSEFLRRVTAHLIDKKAKQSERDIIEGMRSPLLDNSQTPLGEMFLIEVYTVDNRWMLYDSARDKAMVFAPRPLERLLDQKFGKEIKSAWMGSNTKHVLLSYDPHKPRFFEQDAQNCFNSYNAPDWRKDWVPDTRVTTLPSEIQSILEHLVPNERDRGYLLSWLKDAVFNRAEQVLVLRGEPGCGKNLFIENIGAALVGNDGQSRNYFKAPRKFTSSGFHAFIARSQIFCLDEFTLNSDLKETLKDYHNGIAALEEKFEKMDAPKKIPCSFVVIANEKSKIHLDYGDRKFYVPTLNNLDLQVKHKREWINWVCNDLLKDISYLQRIASYLFTQVPNVETYPINTPQFMELCWVSLPSYLQRFINFSVTRRSFSNKQFYDRHARVTKVEFDTLRERVNAFAIARKIDGGVGVFQRNDNAWEFISHIYKREDLIHKDNNVRHLELVTEGESNIEAIVP